MGIQEIISKAPKKIRNMLESVYTYCSQFVKNNEQEEILESIINAMIKIDRAYFYKEEEAYLDTALGIGQGQTISQPSTVARMLMLAELKKGDSVLEVGTGSGWNASLLAFFVYPGKVISLDIYSELVRQARENYSKLGQKLNIEFRLESIFEHSGGNYDKIIFTAGIPSLEIERKVEKIAEGMLKPGGVLVCPRTAGKITVFRKDNILRREETEEEYVFVPLLE